MGKISTIGLDIVKSVFQVHGVEVDGALVIRKRVSRNFRLYTIISLCDHGIITFMRGWRYRDTFSTAIGGKQE
jgi:hypothetical protein